MADSQDMVSCVCCGKDEPIITSHVPFGGEMRAEIQSGVGMYCWRAWMEQQLKIINEYRLNLGDSRSSELLKKACRQFLKLDGDEQVEMPETGPDKARELGNLPE
jgi:Fe-S cluster biosynthesis and repair protein YggX